MGENNPDLNPDKELVFSVLATNVAETSVAEDKKKAMFNRIHNLIHMPAPVGGYTMRTNEADWIQVTEQIKCKILYMDETAGTQINLWELQPGATMMQHNHMIDEECLVLKGSLQVGQHIVSEGDFHLMKAGAIHPEIISLDGCLLYIRQSIQDCRVWLP